MAITELQSNEEKLALAKRDKLDAGDTAYALIRSLVPSLDDVDRVLDAVRNLREAAWREGLAQGYVDAVGA